ncbi:sigma-70 family RNA polymerase sigma factor [Demequina sp. TTPB684]|uniref:RNA polymerase sigma factor n=1 Tax=unclassified Demequina TaxID=2620311 RepID=UPI001CF41B96|nr:MULTISPECIES: sigma-70 family RNA polymerase sigma factor [unclassified Demequina]MCB2413950.1 sigma-70 family RNA polymerase sigma factor [Demequina sp. TTPB684]UPU88697.1 sigma-70 family RNA polymerase sigma factor [Demequina sp. TMPB413]
MSAWRVMLDQLVRERGRALFGYAFALTGDRYDADDLLQDALVRAFRSGRTASSLDAAHSYVKRAIATAFIDRSRRLAARPLVSGTSGDFQEWVRGFPISPDHAGDVESALDLQSALLVLAPRERACIVLRFMDDLTVDAVAEALGLAPGTVKRYLSDARAKLREVLPELDLDDPETASVHMRDGSGR